MGENASRSVSMPWAALGKRFDRYGEPLVEQQYLHGAGPAARSAYAAWGYLYHSFDKPPVMAFA
jgi:hypothetical protein